MRMPIREPFRNMSSDHKQDHPVRHRRGGGRIDGKLLPAVIGHRKKPVADQPICSDDEVRRIDPV
jgi:hypothetical protein